MTDLPPPGVPPGPAGHHPVPGVLTAYAAGRLGPRADAAVEVHLSRCESCRASVGAAVEPQRLAGNWRAIDAELDVPRRRLPERLLVAVGVPSDVARLMGATPALRRSWFVAVTIALVFGLAAADPDRAGSSVLLLLALAPLVPVAGVALAYGPGVDPAHEVTVVTPISGFRLVMIRSLAVVATSIGLAGVASLLVVARAPMAGAWLVPALALSALCLALTTWLRPRVAGGSVAGAWLAGVVLVSLVTGDDLAMFGLGGQVAMAGVLVVATGVLLARRASFDRAAPGGGAA